MCNKNISETMTNENYHRCKTCRFCKHDGDSWTCIAESRPTEPESDCGRYRPGCCENCNMFSKDMCTKDGSERFELDVCTEYDPKGSV